MKCRAIAVVLFGIISIVFAQDKIKQPVLSGWGWLTMGQVQKTEPALKATVVDFNKKWLVDFQTGLKITQPVLSRSVCKLHFMASMQIPVVNVSAGTDNAEPLIKTFSLSILDASIKTYWDIFDNDTIIAEFGYLPVKYNPDAMNLGEYLFRSNAYPALVTSGFEIADKVKIAGFHSGIISNTNTGLHKFDLFLNTETESYPTYDISLSMIGEYTTPKSFIDIAAGLSFYHMIPFDEKRTTPGKTDVYNTISTFFVDSLTGDTTDYTFRGAKAIARMSIDPKVFFNHNILGKNDLRIYTEAAMLGIKNYPGWFNDRRERMPWMFGINLPAFKLLDVCALEFEYFPNPYMNAYQYIWKSNSPVPYFETNTNIDYYSDWKEKHDDDWKWSLYLTKKFNHTRLSGQIASDHSSRACYLPAGKKLYTEMVPRTKDWYFMLRCEFFF